MKRVKIIGIGGIGSWLVDWVAQTLCFHSPETILILVDGDNFEAKNAERQAFTTMGNKAVAKARELRESKFLGGIEVLAMPVWVVSDNYFDSPDNDEDQGSTNKIKASDLLDEDDVVFVCVDNHPARRDIFAAAANINNIDIFSGGNGDRETGDPYFGSTYHYRRRDGQDISAHPFAYHPEVEFPKDKNPGELSCAERAKLEGGHQVLAANVLVASFLLALWNQYMFEPDAYASRVTSRAEFYIDLNAGAAVCEPRPVPAPKTSQVSSSTQPVSVS